MIGMIGLHWKTTKYQSSVGEYSGFPIEMMDSEETLKALSVEPMMGSIHIYPRKFPTKPLEPRNDATPHMASEPFRSLGGD